MSFGRFIRVLAGLALLLFFIYSLICVYQVSPKLLEPEGWRPSAAEAEPAAPDEGDKQAVSAPAAETEPAGPADPTQAVDPGTVPVLTTVPPEENAPETAAAETPEPAPEVTPEPTPDPDSPAARAAALGLPAPPDVDIDSWEFILANEYNPIGEYEPQDPTDLEGQIFDARIVDAMKAMVADTREQGLSVYLSSGYRSYYEQQANYNRKREQYPPEGKDSNGRWIVLPPGTSEHQTGLCCDITYAYVNPKDTSLADTPMYQYMSKHCQEFGFVVRYPDDKQEITGVMYEPWHFRYVGIEAATYMMENGLCLEEFVALYRDIGTAENPAGDWRS